VKQEAKNISNLAALADQLDIRLHKALGLRAWLGQTRTGTDVVLKRGPGAGSTAGDFLAKCAALYPTFDYPQVISAEPGSYLLYNFIPGEPLDRNDFESEENLAGVFDLSGRVTALCRSLKLARMFQGLQTHAAGPLSEKEMTTQGLAALGSGLNCQLDGLAIRRWEAAQSYAWAQEIVAYCASRWSYQASHYPIPWEALRQRVESVTSIHLTGHGSLLAHTCFTPEHILVTGLNRWGLVGWQVAPRPYNYMRYKYLAWSLMHSIRGEIDTRYREYIKHMPTIHTAAANSLTFALSLLEVSVETREGVEFQEEKFRTVLGFIDEALTVSEADERTRYDKH
jgi:hypothetical protein